MLKNFHKHQDQIRKNGNSGNNLPGKFNNYLYVHKNRHFDNKPRL